ncbi:hypothetical protein COCVIDRAFT_88444, partial [Bipolaris victoriae FI3]
RLSFSIWPQWSWRCRYGMLWSSGDGKFTHLESFSIVSPSLPRTKRFNRAMSEK